MSTFLLPRTQLPFNDPMDASSPRARLPPSLPGRTAARVVSTTLPASLESPHTKNHIDAPSAVAANLYSGLAGWTTIGWAPGAARPAEPCPAIASSCQHVRWSHVLVCWLTVCLSMLEITPLTKSVLLCAFTTTTLEAEVLESFRIWLSKVSAKGAEYEFKVRRVTSRSSRTSTMSNTLVRLADLHRQ